MAIRPGELEAARNYRCNLRTRAMWSRASSSTTCRKLMSSLPCTFTPSRSVLPPPSSSLPLAPKSCCFGPTYGCDHQINQRVVFRLAPPNCSLSINYLLRLHQGDYFIVIWVEAVSNRLHLTRQCRLQRAVHNLDCRVPHLYVEPRSPVQLSAWLLALELLR
ncbi:hypothetical protein LIA77_07696 [Sarocladium implicatum]|nr:hypothetical protein LIA77_07696 [Sarocladium implicatum]